MNNEILEIANRIKEMREILDVTREDLAVKLGIDIDLYNKYEDAVEDMPISVLYKIAAILNVDPTLFLTGDDAKMDSYTIVRSGNGAKVKRHEGYDFASLASNFKNRDMEPMIVKLNGNDEKAELITHNGQEFNYVLKGSLVIRLGTHEFLLNQGDSIYFNPMIPHGQFALKGTEAEFLTIINEK